MWVDGIAARADAELLWARGDADAVRIRYSVSGAPADVRLEIFDVRGRRVATPLSEARPAGVWTLEWPARSDTGQRLSHGLYFVRLRTPFVSRQVKLTLAPR